MANIASCEVELNHMNNGMRRVLNDTVRIFREACEMVGKIVEERWDGVEHQGTSQDKLTYVESLIHTTKNNLLCFCLNGKNTKAGSAGSIDDIQK